MLQHFETKGIKKGGFLYSIFESWHKTLEDYENKYPWDLAYTYGERTNVGLLALAATKDVRFKRGTDLAFNQIMLGYSREDELLADQLAVKYVQQSGYNPQAIISFLEKLMQLEKEAPLKPLTASYVRTHPYLAQRIGVVKQEIYGKMDFNDFINISSNEE